MPRQPEAQRRGCPAESAGALLGAGSRAAVVLGHQAAAGGGPVAAPERSDGTLPGTSALRPLPPGARSRGPDLLLGSPWGSSIRERGGEGETPGAIHHSGGWGAQTAGGAQGSVPRPGAAPTGTVPGQTRLVSGASREPLPGPALPPAAVCVASPGLRLHAPRKLGVIDTCSLHPRHQD